MGFRAYGPFNVPAYPDRVNGTTWRFSKATIESDRVRADINERFMSLSTAGKFFPLPEPTRCARSYVTNAERPVKIRFLRQIHRFPTSGREPVTGHVNHLFLCWPFKIRSSFMSKNKFSNIDAVCVNGPLNG